MHTQHVATQPLSAEELARLRYDTERELARHYGMVVTMQPFEALHPCEQAWRIAVANRLLDHVDARMKHILSGLYEGMMMKREETASEQADVR